MTTARKEPRKRTEKKVLVTAIPGYRAGLWIIVKHNAVVKFEHDPANSGYLNDIIRIVTKAVKATNKKHHMISKRLEVTSEVFTESLDGDVDT